MARSVTDSEPLKPAPLRGAHISWKFCLITFSFVALEAATSWFEGTFTRQGYQKVPLPFILHGGALYDLFFFPFVNGVIWRFIQPRPIRVFAAFLALGLVITVGLHVSWYQAGSRLAITDWVWPTRETGNWLRDMGIAGFMHCIFMTIEIAIVSSFVLAPVPRREVWHVAWLLAPFPVFGSLMPSWVVNNGYVDLAGVISALVVFALTWILSTLKVLIALS